MALKFEPRPANVIDKKIKTILKLLKINDVPLVCLRDQLYFVGVFKVAVSIQGDFLMVKLGPGMFERLTDFLKHNRANFRRILALLSLKNDRMSVVQIVNKIIKNEYLAGFCSSGQMQSSVQESGFEHPRFIHAGAYASTQGLEQMATISPAGHPPLDRNLRSSDRHHPFYRSAAVGDAPHHLQIPDYGLEASTAA